MTCLFDREADCGHVGPWYWLACGIRQNALKPYMGFPPIDPILKKRFTPAIEDWCKDRNERRTAKQGCQRHMGLADTGYLHSQYSAIHDVVPGTSEGYQKVLVKISDAIRDKEM
ncbi:MAG: hypothetical protein ACPG5U_10435 [Planktomarina sp.]